MAWSDGQGIDRDMFDTIFEKVTSYFNQRSLVSAFFPNLVFWGLTFLIIIVPQMGWEAIFKIWDGLKIVAQVLLVIAFLSWVIFCSFLTINFRAALIRLYEGYWPNTGFFGSIYNLRRKYWQKRWEKQDTRDNELKEQQGILRTERKEYEKLLNSLEVKEAATRQPSSEQAEQVEKQLNKLLGEVEVCLRES